MYALPPISNTTFADTRQDNLTLTTPYCSKLPPISNPATTQEIIITGHVNDSGSFLWYMNGVSFRGDYK